MVAGFPIRRAKCPNRRIPRGPSAMPEMSIHAFHLPGHGNVAAADVIGGVNPASCQSLKKQGIEGLGGELHSQHFAIRLDLNGTWVVFEIDQDQNRFTARIAKRQAIRE